jgi:hypothetical protein
MWHTERQLHIVHTHVTADGPKNKFRPDVQFIKLGICVKPAATGEEFWLVTVTLIIYRPYYYVWKFPGKYFRTYIPKHIPGQHSRYYVSHHCRRAFLLATVSELDVLC